MQIVDAHHHLWDLTRNRYAWADGPDARVAWGSLAEIRGWDYAAEDFLADHASLEPKRWEVAGSVHVQAEFDPEDPAGETRWLDRVAEESGFPTAIVGGANLADPGVERVLAGHCVSRRIRGIRQLLNRHATPHYNFADRDYLRDATWRKNLGLLAQYGLSFDLQVYYQQAEDALAVIEQHGDVQFVLNHGGMPIDRDADSLDHWKRALERLAEAPNVTAKISGLAMVEPSWGLSDLKFFVNAVTDAFGCDRCMLASNFPIERLRKSYADVWDGFDTVTSELPEADRRKLFHDNAIRVYRL